MTQKVLDIGTFGFNVLFGFMFFNIEWNINTVTALLSLLWLILGRGPKVMYLINKIWHGAKATFQGKKLDRKEYLDKDKEDES